MKEEEMIYKFWLGKYYKWKDLDFQRYTGFGWERKKNKWKDLYFQRYVRENVHINAVC